MTGRSLHVTLNWNAALRSNSTQHSLSNSRVCIYPETEANAVEAFRTHLGPCPVSKLLSVGDVEDGFVGSAVEGCASTLQKDLLLAQANGEQRQQGPGGEHTCHFGSSEARRQPQSSYRLLAGAGAVRWIIHRLAPSGKEQLRLDLDKRRAPKNSHFASVCGDLQLGSLDLFKLQPKNIRPRSGRHAKRSSPDARSSGMMQTLMVLLLKPELLVQRLVLLRNRWLRQLGIS